MDLAKTEPESKDALRIMKLAALNTLGRAEEMKTYYKKDIKNSTYTLPPFNKMALWLLKNPSLPPDKAFAAYIAKA